MRTVRFNRREFFQGNGTKICGAIVLTLKDETRFIKKQRICDQVARTKANSLEIVKVKSGEGIDL